MIKKPMLSGTLDSIEDARFPLLATPKLDGIRCLIIDDKAVSRKFKAIPNHHVRSQLETHLKGLVLDGELMVRNANFNGVQSGIMSEEGEPDFEFWVFDYLTDMTTPYYKRMEQLGALSLPKFCKKVLPVVVNNAEELANLEVAWLAQGFEGVMLRSMTSPYKNGRSTLKEHYLLKLKQFKDSEAKVIGFVEQLHNSNEAEIDELGHTKRSKAQDGMIPANTLGKFIVVEVGDTPWKGKEFFVGTGEGLTAELRKDIWNNRDKFLGKLITYKYQPHGVKDLPRLPIWKGFRDERDT
jgi:DNA ligase-1